MTILPPVLRSHVAAKASEVPLVLRLTTPPLLRNPPKSAASALVKLEFSFPKT